MDSEKKKHADFQDSYRRSSNFGNSDKLEPREDGEVTISKDKGKSTKEIRKSVNKLLDTSEEE
tara:strand:+ start:597 stop:785 length:189 start_codon:yes stop_codon:yes gene_type:complete